MAKKEERPKGNRHILDIKVRGDEENPDDVLARTLTRPEVQAGTLIQKLEGDNHEVNAVVRELEKQVAAVQGGDLRRGEAMLVAQAHSLDELFSNLARRANQCIVGGYRDAGETYLRLALKAQSQCRTTWETLGEIKNPRTLAFVKQANIAHGPQQVNNGATQDGSRAKEIKLTQTKLLEADHGQRLDTNAPGTAGGANQELEAVATVYGTAHNSG